MKALRKGILNDVTRKSLLNRQNEEAGDDRGFSVLTIQGKVEDTLPKLACGQALTNSRKSLASYVQ